MSGAPASRALRAAGPVLIPPAAGENNAVGSVPMLKPSAATALRVGVARGALGSRLNQVHQVMAETSATADARLGASLS